MCSISHDWVWRQIVSSWGVALSVCWCYWKKSENGTKVTLISQQSFYAIGQTNMFATSRSSLLVITLILLLHRQPRCCCEAAASKTTLDHNLISQADSSPPALLKKRKLLRKRKLTTSNFAEKNGAATGSKQQQYKDIFASLLAEEERFRSLQETVDRQAKLR